MRQGKSVRICKVFRCRYLGKYYCCADCCVRADCPDPCLNHPSRCGLENVSKRGEGK